MRLALVAFALCLSAHAAPWGADARDRFDQLQTALEQTREMIGADPGVERVEIGTRSVGTGIIVATLTYSAERRLMERFPSDTRVNDVPLIIECRHRLLAFYKRIQERVTHSAAGFTSAGMRFPEAEPPYLEIGFDQSGNRAAFQNYYPEGSSVEGVRIVTVLTGTPRFQGWASVREWFRKHGSREPTAFGRALEDLRRTLAPDFPRAAVGEGFIDGKRVLAVHVTDKEDAFAFLKKFPSGSEFYGYEVRLVGLPPGPCQPNLED